MKILLRTIGLLLILTSGILFFWQDIQEYFTNQVNEQIFDAYQDGEDSVEINRLESLVTGADFEKTDEHTAHAAGINISSDMAGILNIESADISEPLYYGPVTEDKMRTGVSFVNPEDHLDMQNLPIAGHRVEGSGIRFNDLDRVEAGDIVTIMTREETREYEITEIFNVAPSQVEVLDQKEDSARELTLITCDDYNPETLLFEERMIVKAEIIE